MFRDTIKKALQEATGLETVQVDVPVQESFGDYSSNVALQGGRIKNKELGIKEGETVVPRILAESIIKLLEKDTVLMEIVEKIEIAGPGFLNFWVKEKTLIENLRSIQEQKERYGTSELGKGETVVVDYSAPNIAKPFGIGHLRSTIIGQAIYNLYKALGYTVIGDNHLGDWGTQFGKLIYMIKKENITEFDIAKLEELYVQFHKLAHEPENTKEMEEGAREWFKKLEDGDVEARDIWKRCIDISMKEFQRIYDMLNVTIDNALGESFYESSMKVMMSDPNVVKFLSPMTPPSKGFVIDLSKYGIPVPLMYLKSDGGTTYATRDLATLKYRIEEWHAKIIIYEVGAEQKLYFEQLFAAAREMQIVSDDTILYHTNHGLYLGTDGKKFSTRKGKTIKLEEVLDEAVDRAKKLGNSDEETSKQVGIGAIKYFDLMHSVQSNVVFDWEKIMNMEGNSGPYLQYTYARSQSVLGKAEMINAKLQMLNGEDALELNPEELLVLRTLPKFTEVIQDAAENYSPNILCNYLYDLAQKFNTFYNKHRILEADITSSKQFRVALTDATARVLQNGLQILGIETPEKM
jgi:arginyl-tRNA synthetase